jgi:phenylacetate-CoA ligase
MNFRGKVFKLIQSYRTRQFDYYDKLRKWSSFDRDEIEKLQDQRLRELLDHAASHTEYYHTVLTNSGVITEDGDIDVENFRDIPILDKETIRSNQTDLISSDIESRDWYPNTSGGSTGEPVELVQDADVRDWKHAGKMFFNSWTGYTVGEPRIRLWGSERDVLKGTQSLQHRVKNFLMNEKWINTFNMSREDMFNTVHEINRVEPVQILAYVESVTELTEFIQRESLDVFSPEAIMTSAGRLDRPMRETIEEVFEAPVYDRYGSREVGDMACECPSHNGLHICAPNYIIEILNEDEKPADPGEPGEVVVTSLTNYAMPLIRYKIGDMAVKSRSECDCGCSWPLLTEITGRISDTFITTDGNRIHGEYFTHLFYHRDWVKRFKVIQEDYDYILIKIVASAEPEPDELDDVREKVWEVMGGNCNVDFEFLESLSASDSGKFRYTVSKVHDDSK